MILLILSVKYQDVFDRTNMESKIMIIWQKINQGNYLKKGRVEVQKIEIIKIIFLFLKMELKRKLLKLLNIWMLVKLRIKFIKLRFNLFY